MIVDPEPSPAESPQPASTAIGESYQTWLEQIRMSDEEYRRIVRTALLAQELRDYFAREKVPDEAEHVYLHFIPVDTEASANEVLSRLRGGEDFGALAAEYSVVDEVKASRGDIGWMPRGIFPEMDEVAFNLAIGNVSDVVATSEGFYVLKITGYEESMPVVDEARTELGTREFESWLQEQRETNVVSYLDENDVQWALDHIG